MCHLIEKYLQTFFFLRRLLNILFFFFFKYSQNGVGQCRQQGRILSSLQAQHQAWHRAPSHDSEIWVFIGIFDKGGKTILLILIILDSRSDVHNYYYFFFCKGLGTTF